MKAEIEIRVTEEDIDDIMSSALDSGITYWCSRAKVVGDYLGEYASEQISRGGSLELSDFVGEQNLILTKEKFLAGLRKYIENPDSPYSIIEFCGNQVWLDVCAADATVADSVIQYALFDDIIYG